jgi:TPR repeat protein
MLAAVLLLALCADPAQVRRLALRGDADAQWQAVRLAQQGKLKGVSVQRLEQWRRQAAGRGIPEAQYLLALHLLDSTAAEDEPQRFEGLAWLALAARAGWPEASKRWQRVAEQLGGEELEIVEQKTKSIRLNAVQPSKSAVQ